MIVNSIGAETPPSAVKNHAIEPHHRNERRKPPLAEISRRTYDLTPGCHLARASTPW
jgi:hypothetical protein